MPIYFVEVKSYVVSFARSTSRRPIEPGRPWSRQLKLKVRSAARGLRVSNIQIEFFDSSHENYQHTIGERNHSQMSFYLADREFADLYKILQTEKPLAIVWDEHVNTPEQSFVQNWRITTSLDEPLGEGQTDNN